MIAILNLDVQKVTLHDDSEIEVVVDGTGPTILLSVNPIPTEGEKAEELRAWGVDPALGRTFIDGLRDRFRVVAFDYEGQVQKIPKPTTLTAENIAKDFLAIADAVDAHQFAYYGYSWLALCGMQLAIRTDRLSALIMGGFPPIDGPYKQMLKVTQATHAMTFAPQPPTEKAAKKDQSPDSYDWSTVKVTMSEPQTKQFVTLYEGLQKFDDRLAQKLITCPRLCFAGTNDDIQYGERWGNVRVTMADPIMHNRRELEAFGWDSRLLDDLDHTGAMQPKHVLPVIHPWLEVKLIHRSYL